MVTGNSIRIRWRLKGEKTKARERETKKEKKEEEEGTAYWRGEDGGRGEKRMEAPPGEPRSHPRSKLSDNL